MSERFNKNNSWWLACTGTEPKVRWLAVFRRNLPVSEHSPKRLTIPELKAGKPGSVSAYIYNTPVVLPLQPVCPVNNISPGLKEISSGSASLDNVLKNEERIAPSLSPSSEEDRLWEKIKLPTDIPGVPLARRLVYRLQPSEKWIFSADGPLKFPYQLFPYQLEGVKALVSRDSLLLADDMGLGKTIQAIAAMRILIQRREAEKILIAVPASLVTQWRKELRIWAPELRISTVQGPAQERAYQWNMPAHIYLTGHETLREDFTHNEHSPPRRVTWDLVVLDEAQKIKNRETEISRKCKRLIRKRTWALTGTPLENDPDDLASIIEFVRPLKQGEEPKRIIPGPAMLELHRSLQLRRKKSEVLPQLPPKTVSTIVLPLEVGQWETYQKAEKEGILQLKDKGQFLRIENVLELILRLKQICNVCPRTNRSSKLEDIRNRLTTLVLEGHRAIVFSQFTDNQYGVQAIVRSLRSFSPMSFTGELSIQQKNAVLNSFKSDSSRKVLVLSLRAGGQGLNLQEASYVFHFDRWWNPAVEHQAEDRTHRLGQTLPVHVYQYVCENTIEERIEQILQQKQALFDELVDGVSIDIKSLLTREELFGLFGLKPPAPAAHSNSTD